MRDRLTRAWPVLLIAAAIAWQYRAPLLGRVWSFEDIEAFLIPHWLEAARQMRGGMVPSWSTAAWSGFPIDGDPQLGIFYPLHWLWLAMHPLRVYAWLSLGHAALAAAGMFALCRLRGRSPAAATLAAIAIALSAFYVLELRHEMFGASTAWLIWLLWSIERYAQSRRIEHVVVGGAFLGLALLAGGWSLLYFGAIAAAIFAGARLAAATRDRRRLAAGYAAMVALGVALAGVQLLPALRHAALSPRGLGVDYKFASTYAWPSLRYLITLLFPTWYGSVARGNYSGADDQWELCGWAIGFVATVLVPFALISRERRGERITLLVALVCAIDLARGAGGLLHPLFFRAAPFYAQLRCPARALYLWTLTAPILAADGLDALPPGRWRALAPFALAVELAFLFRAENPSTTLRQATLRPDAVGWAHEIPKRRMINDVHLPQRFHNGGLAWNYESAVGYSSVPIWRYLQLLWIANHGAPYPSEKLAHDLTAQGLWRFQSPIVDLLGVELVMTSTERPLLAAGFTPAYQPADGIEVWRNSHAYPLAFVVYRTQLARDDAAQARAIADPKFRPARVAIVDHPIAGVPELRDGEVPPVATDLIALVRETPYDVAIEVVTKRPGVMVIAEAWYPGWRVTVDGFPAELLRVDLALRGVAVPAGTHTIALDYEDDPLAYGGALSLTALALAFGLLVYARRSRRG